MKKTLVVLAFLSASFLLTGCGKQDAAPSSQPSGQKPAPTSDNKAAVTPTANPTTAQSSLESTAPKSTNDLPTAIEETEKDLQVIESDLDEIDKMDLSEENIEL